MSQSITLWGATYSNVPAVNLPKQGGGTAQFDDTSDADATASDIASGKTAYVNGTKITGTGSGGGDAPIWQGADDYVYVSDTAAAPVEIYTDGDYVVLDIVPAQLNLQTKSVSPTESAQSVTADVGYDALEQVNVGAISSSYVGSGVARKSSSDLTVSGDTVTAPAGYYESNATKTVASGSATPASTISGTSATVSTGTNTLTLSKTVSNTPQVSAGYISSGTAGNSSVSLTASVTTKAAATYTPSTSTQTISSDQYLTGAQTINPIPSQYIVPTGTKSITANGTGIDVASYASVDVAVPTGSPTLITKNITANGTYNASSDSADGYSSVTVNVSGGGGGLEYESGTYTPSEDIARPTISFSNSHSEAPVFVSFSSVYEDGDVLGTYENITFLYCDVYKLYGEGFISTGTSMAYAIVFYRYTTSTNTAANAYTLCSQKSDSQVEIQEQGIYPRFWVQENFFNPYTNNSSRYWKAGKTYKWIAVWAPTT